MKLGNFTLKLLSEGRFKLDGGVVYGVAPRILWEKYMAPDENNCIPLELTMLLVKTPEGVVLIESGIGPNCPPYLEKIYQVERTSSVPHELEKAGIDPEDVNYWILTHLHFDHLGGIGSPGRKHIVCPNARIVIQEKEWNAAHHPHLRDKTAYLAEDLEMLEKSGRLMLVDGDSEILAGIKVHLTGGHSPGHQVVFLESQGEKACFAGDLIPMPGNERLLWVSAIDGEPMKSVEEKARLLPLVIEEQWIVFLGHFPCCGYIKKEGKHPKFIKNEVLT
ncbi:MAG: MBL fold metallo-hydrolase [Candidatus Eremiobacteraeota bacterium]|nr:MBL fold metallo-hydrolase [Candidatus Eremiobacteraeota bacterium]